MATVLIVDDDRFTRSVLQTALTKDPAFANLDIETHTADNGQQALLDFQRLRPDAVIVDLLMPQMDGFALCRSIRDLPRGDLPHLICMSGIYRDHAVIQRVKSEYRAEFFAKPYQLRELTAHLANLLEMDARGEDSRSFSLPMPEIGDIRGGDLAERPLPAVLIDLLEERASGRLHLQRGRVRKSVELLVGHPRSVASTARDETLGHFLTAFGVLTEDQVKYAVAQAAETKHKLSDVIVGMGLLSPEQMVQRLTMLTAYRLAQSLRWPDGDWRFEPGMSPNGLIGGLAGGSAGGNPVDMIAVVLQGLAYTASVDEAPDRVLGIEHSPLELTERGRALESAIRKHLSERFIDQFRDGDTLAELVDKGVERSQLLTTLDALLLCDAIQPRDPLFSYIEESEPSVEAAIEIEDVTFDAIPVPTRQTGELSVKELSDAVHTRRSERGTPQQSAPELYNALFDDVSIAPAPAGAIPIELPDEASDVIDSGQIDITTLQRRIETTGPTAEETNFARRVLLKEYLRIQGLDHYELLKVDTRAGAEAIARALEQRKSKLSMDWYARFDLGRDYAKLEEIHAAYEQAAKVLLDPEARASYDRSRGVGVGQESEELTLDAEIAYHAGRDLLEHGSYQGAIEHLQAAIAAAPDEAEYHAMLGWAYYLEGGRTPRAADAARPHLNQGLLINADHALSHAYKGIISAELGIDQAEAVFHLERALDADPSCAEALQSLQSLWLERGELRPLERLYRRLIYRTSGTNPEIELALWCKLAQLYMDKLGEPDNARVAFESAARLAPDDPVIQAALRRLGSGIGDRFTQMVDTLREEWSASPMHPEPALQLMHMARDTGRPDPAFMAASALVARQCTENEVLELYQRYRPRFVMRAYRQMDEHAWSLLRHARDTIELEQLFALLEPVIERSFPFDAAELEVDVAAMEVAEEDLPEPFVRVRAYVAHMLGIAPPKVIARPEYGHQIHVAALTPPVLLAGDQVLTSPERLELAFRLGRAMTYLLPGRTLAGARPTRLLKAAVLAVYESAHPELSLDDPQGYIARVKDALRSLPPDSLTRARALVLDVTQQSASLNLSLWAQALARTANRFGLMLCGDLPQTVRFARDSSTPAVIDDLIDFSVSRDCWTLRGHLGLSIDV